MESLIKELESSLRALISRLNEELQAVRSNRPSVQLVENIPVECYGQQMTLKQLGSLAVRPPRDIEITLWDKSAIPAVMKAIQDSNAGLSLGNDGALIRASLPMLTEERRAEFTKLAKKMVEATRIQIRARRDEANKKLKSAQDEGAANEDQVFNGKERIQKIVDEENKRVDAMLETKLAELAE